MMKKINNHDAEDESNPLNEDAEIESVRVRFEGSAMGKFPSRN
jgi:hypothetical protein